MLRITIRCFPEGAILRIEGDDLHTEYTLSLKSMDRILGVIGRILPKMKPFWGPDIAIKEEPKRKKK